LKNAFRERDKKSERLQRKLEDNVNMDLKDRSMGHEGVHRIIFVIIGHKGEIFYTHNKEHREFMLEISNTAMAHQPRGSRPSETTRLAKPQLGKS
jgi:hypothetical protein